MYLRKAVTGRSKSSTAASGVLVQNGRYPHGQAVERGRDARMWLSAFSVVTLLLLGASPALAAGAPPAADSAETVAPAADGEMASEDLQETPPPQLVVEEPPIPPTATSAPVSLTVTEQPAPPATDIGAQGGTGGAGLNSTQGATPGDSAGAPAPAARMMSAEAAPEPPYLRWVVVDPGGASVAATKLAVQGPRDDSVTDKKGEKQWLSATVATVADNTGEADYSGADLDPAPGSFLVKTLTADTDANVTKDVAADEHYRVRPAEAAGWLVGGAAEWVASDVAVAAETEVTKVTLVADPDYEGVVPQVNEDVAKSQGLAVAPLVAGPDLSGPYVYWETRNKAGNGLVGGASYRLQGPRTSSTWYGIEYNVVWNNNEVTVPDCVAATCSGPDLDPDQGEFLVKQIDDHNISSVNRYRVQQVTSPSGYTFSNANNPWVEIPGNRNTPTGWVGNTYDFGDFMVRKIPPKAPLCEVGYVYGVTAGGQLVQVSNAGTSTGVKSDLGTKANGVSSFNGLGIGTGGDPVYAVERTGSDYKNYSGTIYKYDTAAGTWGSTGVSVSNTGTNLVGGAVNLATGLYYFGGFTSNGDFKIYEYDPSATPKTKVKGTVKSAYSSGSDANGDIAFNANGDLFVVGSVGDTTSIYSVSAADFNAASGGNMSFSGSTSKKTMSDVNGVAFDSAGLGYLGSRSQMRSYNMPSWSDKSTPISSGLGTDDLASCSSPATITIEKVVEGARVSSGDKFALTLNQGNTVLGTATAESPASGLQAQRIGPQPTARGVTLTFTEAAAGTTDMANYASSWSCMVDGEPMAGVAGTGVTGTITIPASGKVFNCRFTNAPLNASIKLVKTKVDTAGETSIGVGWPMTAVISATTGSLKSVTPSGSNQNTSADGSANWALVFGTATSRAKVTVSEGSQDGYQFSSGSCLIRSLSGAVTEVTLTNASAQDLTGIAPGDSVMCEYKNRQIAGSISWEKIANDNNGEHLAGSVWSLQGPFTGATPSGAIVSVADCVAADCTSATDKDNRAGYLRVTGLAWGKYRIVETTSPPGFTAPTPPVNYDVEITAENAQDGASFGPVVNVRKLGEVVWKKVSSTNTNQLLAGSVWLVKRLNSGDSGTTVTDCVSGVGGSCTGLFDKDPIAGQFRFEGLAWGNYELTETEAPAGYIRSTTVFTFTIDATHLTNVVLVHADAGNAVSNTPITPPTIPLTGGLGRDFFSMLGGGVLVLGFGAVVLLQLRKRRREVA